MPAILRYLLSLMVICLLWAKIILTNPYLFLSIALWGPFLVLLGASLAIAGKGNRLAWSAIFILLAAVMTLSVSHVDLAPGENGVAKGIIMFAAVPLVPAAILWAAYAFRNWRAKSPTFHKVKQP